MLTGDWLAELTMLILAKGRAKDPDLGFATTFLTQMEQVLGTCLAEGIVVVSNAGGLNPAGCADALAALASRLGLAPTIAYVEGDDLMPRLAELRASGIDLRNLDTGESLDDLGVDPVTANAYLGGWGIADALDRGADVVITGRVDGCRDGPRSGGLTLRVGAHRLGPPGRRGRGRPRARVRRAGHRRQLRVLPRGPGSRAARLPDR